MGLTKRQPCEHELELPFKAGDKAAPERHTGIEMGDIPSRGILGQEGAL
jgi:hypothetical protein